MEEKLKPNKGCLEISAGDRKHCCLKLIIFTAINVHRFLSKRGQIQLNRNMIIFAKGLLTADRCESLPINVTKKILFDRGCLK